MNPRIRILAALGSFMFVTGLIYGAISGNFALDATADETSSFGDSEKPQEGASACLSDPAVLEEIRSQKESINKAQKDLAAKEQELKQREQALADEIKKVQAIRDEISKTEEIRKKENEERVAKVIDTLQTMSPKASAKMLAEMDDSLAVEVLSRMDTAKLAKIMNLLEPKRASALTEILAGVTRAKAAAGATRVASADSVTGRDGVRDSKAKGGENNVEQNHDNTTSSRKPSSVSDKRNADSKGGLGDSKGSAQKGR